MGADGCLWAALQPGRSNKNTQVTFLQDRARRLSQVAWVLLKIKSQPLANAGNPEVQEQGKHNACKMMLKEGL